MASSTQVALKIAHNDDIHRTRVDINTFSLQELTQLMAHTFQLAPGSFIIQYTDPEGDTLNVCSESEYAEACRVFLGDSAGGSDPIKSLKFVAITRSQAAFQEKVADPIVTSIEQLIQALTATVEKVKSEQWAQTARGAVVTTNEAFEKAANDTRESFKAAQKSVQELPYDQVVKDTTDGLQHVAKGFSSFAQGLVGEIKQFMPNREEKPSAPPTPPAPESPPAPPAPPAPEAPPAPPAPPAPEAPPAPPAPPAPVAEPVAAPAVPEPEIPVAAPVAMPIAFTEAELKWSNELSTVQPILPNVESSRLIEMLEQTKGDVNAVINALMEEN